jgi:GTP-binding protein YchF
MSLKCGIVGLPNVGKSTLFNAITKTQSAQAANYPFCTIEPNSGKVAISDERLVSLANIAGSAEIIPNFIEIVDIAGLVKGASNGEGLGNKFLSHIREVDAIFHLVRCFEDKDITHVEGAIDPLRDVQIINTELCLADIESLEKQAIKLEKKAKTDKKIAIELDLLNKVKDFLNQGNFANTFISKLSKEDQQIINGFNLITTKKVIFVANVSESDVKTGNDFTKSLEEFAKQNSSEFAVISVKIESEIAQIESQEERDFFLQEIGLQKSGLDMLAQKGFEILNLITFFTIGPKEAHAWTLKKNLLAPQAAGVIHTDFEKGFIRAETISYPDYINYQGEAGAKDAGRLRLEGAEYVVQDGDVFHFRFNV